MKQSHLSKSIKYLGARIGGENLDWKDHINEIASELMR